MIGISVDTLQNYKILVEGIKIVPLSGCGKGTNIMGGQQNRTFKFFINLQYLAQIFD